MVSPGPQRAAHPSLEAKVAFLREPASYPDPTFHVEARETHMSWVFLLDRHVYKLKKPVCHSLLDFRTVAARRHFCDEEVRLNLRLAPQVYLGLVPLTLGNRRHFALGGSGTIVDWLVRMRRLPAERMLDFAIGHGGVAASDLDRVAATLAAFYRALPPEPISDAAYAARFAQQTQSNLAELSQEVFELSVAHVQRVCSAQLATLGRIRHLLDARVGAGRIVEGHGDLRPEHICLCDPPAVIDCLEFSRELRILDCVDELGFLALECERLGAAATGIALLRRYAELSGDSPPPMLLHFYQSCRASTRALIAARHLLDEKFRHSPHWLRRAQQYLRLAEQHIGQCDQ
jgi:aminoglycoside phosphotransferase family enzyme